MQKTEKSSLMPKVKSNCANYASGVCRGVWIKHDLTQVIDPTRADKACEPVGCHYLKTIALRGI